MVAQPVSRDDAVDGIVAIGASAGGVEALTKLVASVPADFVLPILVALHVPSGAPSVLARILDRSGPLPAVTARDGHPLEPGRIYVAAPDHHLLAHDHRIVLSQGPTENGHRPAINALFRSVAVAFGPRSIGVLLSGVLDDGVLGLAAIRSRGGVTISQDPDDALFPTMPLNARRAGVVDQEVTATEIGPLLQRLADRNFEEKPMSSDPLMELENQVAMGRRFATDFDSGQLGPPSGFTCPDCNGSLSKLGEGNYRCRVGHAWTEDSLLDARDDEIVKALWIALRSLQEKARLARNVAAKIGPGMLQRRYIATAEEAESAMSVLSERLTAGAMESIPDDD